MEAIVAGSVSVLSLVLILIFMVFWYWRRADKKVARELEIADRKRAIDEKRKSIVMLVERRKSQLAAEAEEDD